MQAPQRMQRSTSPKAVPSSSARPLSRMTTWQASGPSGSPGRRGPELRGLHQLAIRRQLRVQAAEVGLDLVLGKVDGRRDDVARRLAADLDQVLAEVGLDHLEAIAFECGIEADLLRDHRLALGD